MKILLTGSTGFIGKALVTELKQQNFDISIAVRQKTNLFSDGVKQFVVGDFENNPDFSTSLSEIDCVIHLSGLQVKDKLHTNGDIEIKFTGLRPGEKLYEELLIGSNVSKTSNPMILRAEEEMLAWGDLKLILDELEQAVDSGDQVKLRQLLIKAVPGFKPQSLITDILYEA